MTSKRSDSTTGRAGTRQPQRGWVSFVDLVAIVALVALVNLAAFVNLAALTNRIEFVDLAAYVSMIDWSLLQAVFGLLLVLFVPGYAFVSALFPEAKQSRATGTGAETGGTAAIFSSIGRGGPRTIGHVERLALAFGVSIAIVPLLFVGLSMFSVEFGSIQTTRVISALTVLFTGIAAIRRWRVPAERRFQVPFRGWSATIQRSTWAASSPFDAVVNIALAISVVFAVGVLSFTVVAPPDGERFTEFYVLNESGESELVAGSYPEVLSPDESERLHVGIENHEQRAVEYTVLVELDRVETRDDGLVVTDRARLDQFSITLAPDETSIREQPITVSEGFTGDDLRLTFLLYVDSVPVDPTPENAYRSLHLWVDVHGEDQ